MSDSPATKVTAKAKPGATRVLRCFNPACNGFLPFEVDVENRLLLDLREFARHDGESWYLPCPRCGARNLLQLEAGAHPRVVGFEGGAATAAGNQSPAQGAEPLMFIPDAVRKKLDRVGIKLHLAQWQSLPLAERARLAEMACGDDVEAAQFRTYLTRVASRCGIGILDELPPQTPGAEEASNS
jgi:hypothetical protein